MLKNLIIFTLIIISSSACKAQQPVPKISSDRLKINNTSYILIKPDNKVTQIINANNKLNNVKQIAPNLPFDIKIPDYRTFDKNLLLQICAETISLTTLKKLPNGYGDWLFITFKVDVTGKILEMEFLVKNTSLITANDIQKVEDRIMRSRFKVTFKKELEPYFVGANYFSIDAIVRYSDMLKVKERK